MTEADDRYTRRMNAVHAAALAAAPLYVARGERRAHLDPGCPLLRTSRQLRVRTPKELTYCLTCAPGLYHDVDLIGRVHRYLDPARRMAPLHADEPLQMPADTLQIVRELAKVTLQLRHTADGYALGMADLVRESNEILTLYRLGRDLPDTVLLTDTGRGRSPTSMVLVQIHLSPHLGPALPATPGQSGARRSPMLRKTNVEVADLVTSTFPTHFQTHTPEPSLTAEQEQLLIASYVPRSDLPAQLDAIRSATH